MRRILHRYEAAVLKALENETRLDLEGLLKKTGMGRDEALWSLEGLAKDMLVRFEKQREKSAELTEEGKRYAQAGLPEERLIKRLHERPIDVSGLIGEEGIGLQWAKKKNYIGISKGKAELTEEGRRSYGKRTEEGVAIGELAASADAYGRLAERHGLISELERRGLLSITEKRRIINIGITERGRQELRLQEAGRDHANEAHASQQRLIEAVDKATIAGRTWEGRSFKEYSVDVNVEQKDIAMRHPLRGIINEIRSAYIGMGFAEINGPVVEPSFWVFDSLFMPQDHPARDIQDTFYLNEPRKIRIGERAEVQRVRKAQTESWRSGWSEEIAEEAVLRTQTTNVTVRYVKGILREILKANGRYELPLKFFTVGRVFRNENIDYKHLADFYQTDGMVIGRGLTLANLFDILISLYKSLGMEVRFRPSYFPFVEPGLEVYAKIPKGDEWIEMGGAGLIRREITGLPRKSITVLAWGLGIERMLLLRKSGIGSIAELYNNSIGWIRNQEVL